MKFRHALILFFGIACLTSSCSTVEEVREKEARKTQRYADWQEKRRIRAKAQDERHEIWVDRIMGNEDDEW